jgi:hypothetical protein
LLKFPQKCCEFVLVGDSSCAQIMGLFRREQQKEVARLTPRLAFLYGNANLSTALRGKFVCYAKFAQVNEREKFLEIHKSFQPSKLSAQNLCR